MQVHRAVAAEGRELVRVTVVLVEETRLAVADDQRRVASGTFGISFKDKLKPGDYTVAIALILGANAVGPEIKIVPYRARY